LAEIGSKENDGLNLSSIAGVNRWPRIVFGVLTNGETIMKRQWLIFSLLFFVFLLVIAGNSQAREDVSTRLKSGGSTVTLYATADAWVDAAAPDTSYGTYDQL